MSRLRALLAAAPVALVLLTAPAEAAEGRIEAVTPTGDGVVVTLSGSGLPPGVGLNPASVVARVDGEAATAKAVVTGRGTAAGAVRRSSMLLVDVSGSMVGQRLAAAKAAATAYLDTLPPDVEVGLTTFGGEVRTVSRPTLDRPALQAAVARLSAAGETHLYDGLVAATSALGTAGDRSILLLSDGDDMGSRETERSGIAALRTSRVSLDAVAVQGDGATLRTLERLAGATGGRVVDTRDTRSLTAALRSAAQEYAAQLAVTVALPAHKAGQSVRVDLEVSAGSERITAGTTVDARAASSAAAATPVEPTAVSWLASRQALFLALLVLFMALAAAGAVLLTTSADTKQRRKTDELLAAYTVRPPSAATQTLRDESTVARSALGAAERVAAYRGLGTRIAARLEAAGMRWQAQEWLLLQAGSAVVGAVLLLVLGTGVPGVLLGAVFGAAAPSLWLRRQAAKRREAFADALPDALQLVVGGLSTGYSFAQALDAVVRDGTQPIAGEIGRAIAESRLGTPLEDCLEQVAERMESEDFRWVVLAVRVQREVGGNLAEVLQTVFVTMRDRARLRREVRTLSAEGRMSAWVLLALPIFMFLYQLLFRRDYLSLLWSEPLGFVMLAVMVLFMIAGGLWTRALVKVDV